MTIWPWDARAEVLGRCCRACSALAAAAALRLPPRQPRCAGRDPAGGRLCLCSPRKRQHAGLD